MGADIMIDGALFLGMHSIDEQVRLDSKAFFAERLDGRVVMSLEQVGLCDNIVWGQPRDLQDAYYPFMDVLHTDMTIQRVPYTEGDLDAARAPDLAGLPLSRRLTVGMARNRGAILHTVDPVLLDAARAGSGLPVRRVPASTVEVSFPAYLEKLYAASLVLRTGSPRNY